MGVVCMSRYKIGEERNQVSIFPVCFDEMIADDNTVRAIDIIVESMDILSLDFKYTDQSIFTFFKNLIDDANSHGFKLVVFRNSAIVFITFPFLVYNYFIH